MGARKTMLEILEFIFSHPLRFIGVWLLVGSFRPIIIRMESKSE